jgi:hypothetical protein
VEFSFGLDVQLYIHQEELLLLPGDNDDVEDSSSTGGDEDFDGDVNVDLSHLSIYILIDDCVAPGSSSKISSNSIPIRNSRNRLHRYLLSFAYEDCLRFSSVCNVLSPVSEPEDISFSGIGPDFVGERSQSIDDSSSLS